MLSRCIASKDTVWDNLEMGVTMSHVEIMVLLGMLVFGLSFLVYISWDANRKIKRTVERLHWLIEQRQR
jgi:hypothetical protein